MNPLFFKALSVILFLSALFSVQPVLAHGDDPRLEINSQRLNPGAVLEIRGVDFEFEEQVTLALIGSQIEIPLGTAIGDEEGIFLVTISLPMDLAEGIYVVHATTDDHVVESPQIMIWGAPQLEEGGQGSRDAADGLLAPMPTFELDFSATPAPQITALETSASKPKSNTLIYSIIVGVGIISLIGMRLLRKR
jgi:hypothetical protein